MLIVETVTAESAAEQAGVQPGDRLLAYDGSALPSPASLLALEENTFHRESVILRLQREGEEIELSIPLGKLGVETRPELATELLAKYEMGRQAFDAKEYAEAARRWSAAAEQAGKDSAAAWLWGKAGEAWEKASEWQEALAAWKAAQKQLDENMDTAAQSQGLTALGRCCYQRNEWDAATGWWHAAQEVDEASGRELWVARAINALGLVAWKRGDLHAAQDYHTHALQIRERLAPNSLDVSGSLNNLGNVAWQRGDLQAAQDYHTRVLQIAERLAPDSLDVATSLDNLGLVARDRGDLQVAQDYHTHALQIRERLAPNSLDVAVSLNNLGNVARERGDLQAAHDYLTRALHIKEHLAPNSLQMAHSLNNLGTVASQRGDFQAAQDYHTHALQIRERLAPDSLDCAESLTQLGRTLLRRHSLDNALPLLQQSVQILEQQRSAIVAPEARALLLAQHTTKFAALIQAHLALGQPVPAFSTLERSRARSLLELLAERRLDFAADASADLLQQQQELDRQRVRSYDQLAKLSATIRDENEVNTLHRQLGELERQQQELTARIRQTSPRYASLQYPQPLDLKAAQTLLNPGTLLLSYLVDEEQTFLFAVTRTTLHAFTLPIGVKALQAKVRAFRTSLDLTDIRNNLPDAIEKGHDLYNLLIAPAEHQVRRARRLLLCPDGPLHLLPWAALVLKPGRSPRYLGAAKPLHTTLSMTVYSQTREEARGKREEKAQERRQPQSAKPATPVPDLTSRVLHTTRRLLALGDPLYVASKRTPALARSAGEEENAAAPDTSSFIPHPSSFVSPPDPELALLQTRGLTLEPLPHTREEVHHLAQLFGDQATLKLGAHATKTAALNESAHADILHFACHGWLDARSPLSSALVLAQPEAMGEQMLEGDNGLLQAWEVLSKMRLDAELVVLSACRTGLGSEVRGEGLIGLTRAFTYAGARSVLVSLWKIQDASTSEFMRLFYTELKEGASKAKSLRSAMRAMSRDARYRHPYYWSAFLLQGDAD